MRTVAPDSRSTRGVGVPVMMEGWVVDGSPLSTERYSPGPNRSGRIAAGGPSTSWRMIALRRSLPPPDSSARTSATSGLAPTDPDGRSRSVSRCAIGLPIWGWVWCTGCSGRRGAGTPAGAYPRARLRSVEVPVRYRDRVGTSKITGTLRGTVLAGTKILWTIARYGLR